MFEKAWSGVIKLLRFYILKQIFESWISIPKTLFTKLIFLGVKQNIDH